MEIILTTAPAAQALADTLIPEPFKKATHFAVMLFLEGQDIGLEGEYAHRWINTRNLIFTDHRQALEAYANIPCPASQLIEASGEEDLARKMSRRITDFSDPAFLEDLYERI